MQFLVSDHVLTGLLHHFVPVGDLSRLVSEVPQLLGDTRLIAKQRHCITTIVVFLRRARAPPNLSFLCHSHFLLSLLSHPAGSGSTWCICGTWAFPSFPKLQHLAGNANPQIWSVRDATSNRMTVTNVRIHQGLITTELGSCAQLKRMVVWNISKWQHV